jgi:hypothetical protein
MAGRRGLWGRANPEGICRSRVPAAPNRGDLSLAKLLSGCRAVVAIGQSPPQLTRTRAVQQTNRVFPDVPDRTEVLHFAWWSTVSSPNVTSWVTHFKDGAIRPLGVTFSAARYGGLRIHDLRHTIITRLAQLEFRIMSRSRSWAT